MGVISDRRKRFAAFLSRWAERLASDDITDAATPGELHRFVEEYQRVTLDLAAAEAADGAAAQRRDRERGN